MSVSLLVPEILIETYFPSNCHFRDFIRKKNWSNGGGNFSNIFRNGAKETSRIIIIIHSGCLETPEPLKGTIFNTLKSGGIKYRKKIWVPKATPAQKEKKMFDHLKAKIRKADQHGLRSLTKNNLNLKCIILLILGHM